ncbi:MAG: hypothetical protein LBS21_14100 [Clostridiales bacterium]|nr:hypothetical protein [Clostridiales bacterium]
MDAYVEPERPEETFISVKLLAINEILLLYSDYDRYPCEFFTKEYLYQSNEWMSRAEFEANMKYQYRTHEKSDLYFDKRVRSLYYSNNPRLSGHPLTLSCGEDYYVERASFNIVARGYEKVLDRAIKKGDVSEYEPGFSFIPVIYPDVNPDYSPREKTVVYDLAERVRGRIKKDNVLLNTENTPKYEDGFKFFYYYENGKDLDLKNSSYYLPLHYTSEALGYAVINDAEKKNYFIYSEDYLEENLNWKSIEKMQGIFAALGKLTGNNVTLRYDENDKSLYFENEAETVGVPAAAFSEKAFVRLTDAMSAYKKIANTDNGSNNALNGILSSM